jgi:hypothetical protein
MGIIYFTASNLGEWLEKISERQVLKEIQKLGFK